MISYHNKMTLRHSIMANGHNGMAPSQNEMTKCHKRMSSCHNEMIMSHSGVAHGHFGLATSHSGLLGHYNLHYPTQIENKTCKKTGNFCRLSIKQNSIDGNELLETHFSYLTTFSAA
jgi:hypothetical protein